MSWKQVHTLQNKMLKTTKKIKVRQFGVFLRKIIKDIIPNFTSFWEMTFFSFKEYTLN